MTLRIAINGFGRMGKLFLRAVWDCPGIEVVHINEPKGGVECAAHLIEFDTIQGRWEREISFQNDSNAQAIVINNKTISYSEAYEPTAVDWAALDIDLLVDCSGKYRTTEALQPFLTADIAQILVSCPVKSPEALNIVYGVNHQDYDPTTHKVVTAASCTTNCLAPVVKVLLENIGIKHGSMTTIHDVTNTQVMVDMPHKDLRRARSGLNSLIPTSTGSATAITKIFPELTGRLNGHAVRVPLLNASLTDCVFELERAVTVEEINLLFQQAAEEGVLKDILGYETRPLVSTDYVRDPRSVIIDAQSTMVVNGTQVKIYAWYDNEWGYVNRMVDIVSMIHQKSI